MKPFAILAGQTKEEDLSTDNNEATAWNGVMAGGQPAPCANESSRAVTTGLAVGGLASLTTGLTALAVSVMRSSQERKRRGK